MIKRLHIVTALVLAATASVALAGDPKAGATTAKMQPKPPAEIADLVKAMTGAWKCKGQAITAADKKMTEMVGVMKVKVELDGWWIHDTYDAAIGKEPLRYESFTSFDRTTKKWHRQMIFANGGWASGDSSGMTAGKMDWDMTVHGEMGDSMFRDHFDTSDAKVGVKSWGELSNDKGKTWLKLYEQVCKK